MDTFCIWNVRIQIWIIHLSISLLESVFFLCVRKPTEKFEYRQKKYFSDGVSSENNPQKQSDRKIDFFCGFTVRNNFSVGLTRTEKLCSPRLKLIFLCVNPHRKKEINAQKNTCFFYCRSSELTEKFISPRLKIIFLCSQPHRKIHTVMKSTSTAHN